MSSDADTPRLDSLATRWSLFRRAHGEGGASAQEARNALVMRYSAAIRRYVGAIMRNDASADEVAQDVIVRMLQGSFHAADPDRGRFRDFLKTAVRNTVKTTWEKQSRRMAADIAGLQLGREVDAGGEEDARWVETWRRSVLENTWAALERHQRERPGSVAFSVLRLRTDFPDDTSDQLAERLSHKLHKPVEPPALRQQLRRARVKFAELLVEEIADGLEDRDAARVEDELIALGLLEYVRGVLGT